MKNYTPFDFVVIGDVNLDWVTSEKLQFCFSELSQNGTNAWCPFFEFFGGTGYNFAYRAAENGFNTLLLGKVGNDISGKLIIEELEKNKKIGNGVSIAKNSPTGKAFIARDKNDIRLLIDNAPNANKEFAKEDILKFETQIEKAKYLFISGYSIKDENSSRFEAVMCAVDIIKRNPDAIIILDVVPHQIYNIYSFFRFKEITSKMDLIISEVATIRRFLGFGEKNENITHEIAKFTSAEMSKHFDSHILRYGASGCDYEIYYSSKTGKTKENTTNHSLMNNNRKRGFGDELAISALVGFFGFFPTISK